MVQVLFTDEESDLWSPHALSLAEWRLLQGATTLLHPFWMATKAWEAEKTPTLNLVIERIYTLHEALTDFVRDRHNCRLTLIILSVISCWLFGSILFFIKNGFEVARITL